MAAIKWVGQQRTGGRERAGNTGGVTGEAWGRSEQPTSRGGREPWSPAPCCKLVFAGLVILTMHHDATIDSGILRRE